MIFQEEKMKGMDYATIIGLAGAAIVIIWSIKLAGDLIVFWDLPSVVCVFGGCTASMLIKFPIESLKGFNKSVAKVIFYSKIDLKETILEITKMAEIARRESIFALEKVQVDDLFMKKALTLAADNRPPEVIQSILQMEIDAIGQRHKEGQDILNELALDGPAFGMIGTLLGLVLMLQNLSDPSSIGPSMAVAILTTFYGAILANVVCNPFKNKLTIRSGAEVTKMNIILTGTLGIVAGENPRSIKEKLNSFLPPSERITSEA